MENTATLWFRKYNRPILLLSAITMALNYILFGEHSVSLWFLGSHFFTIILFLIFVTRFNKRSQEYSTNKFEQKVFWIGLLLRVISIVFFYVFYYIMTGTEFDAAAVDALWYHDAGKQVAQQFSEFRYNFDDIDTTVDFDDKGYNVFLGAIYFIFGPSVIIARIIQGFFGSFTAVLIYRIGKSLYNERTGRMAAILFMFFPLFIYFNALHFKETIMVYFALLGVNAIIDFYNKKNKVKYGAIFLLAIVATFSLRAVLTYTLLATFLVSLLFSGEFKFYQKASITFFIMSFLLLLIWQVGLLDEFSAKLTRYVTVNVEGSVMGNTAERIANNGQSLAKYASAPVMFIQSISFPYPSMVKTNIRFYNQAAQWYHIGGLFLWAYFSYWVILGLYDSIKTNLKKNLPLVAFTLFFSVILVITLYITSVRFNLLKMAPMFIFAAVALNNNNLKRQRYWYIYMVWMSFVILVWNYVKVAGWGLL